MPLQNRVDPHGALIRTTARGTLMGNRGGVLHNSQREIVRQYKSRQWITCVLEFKGRRRVVMSPGLYTELFFLDEAVALSAGHRPCAECRRARFNEFRIAWKRTGRGSFLAPEIDRELHEARKVTWQAPLHTLPDGCFVELSNSTWLVRGESLLLWSPAGYLEKRPRPDAQNVTVLTPEPIVQCIRQDFTPVVHHSALDL